MSGRVVVVPGQRVAPDPGDRGRPSWEDVAALRAEVVRLRAVVLDQATVEQATGMVMLSHGLGSERAHAQLEACARSTGVSVDAVAAVLVARATWDEDGGGTHRLG